MSLSSAVSCCFSPLLAAAPVSRAVTLCFRPGLRCSGSPGSGGRGCRAGWWTGTSVRHDAAFSGQNRHDLLAEAAPLAGVVDEGRSGRQGRGPRTSGWIWSATVARAPANGVGSGAGGSTVCRRVRPLSLRQPGDLLRASAEPALGVDRSVCCGNGASRSYWRKSCQANGRPSSARARLKSRSPSLQVVFDLARLGVGVADVDPASPASPPRGRGRGPWRWPGALMSA